MSSQSSPIPAGQTSGPAQVPAETHSDLPAPQRRRRQARSLQKLRERLPSYTPSPRHLEIFEEVMCLHKHQLEVACNHNISQQRVSKIVRQVLDWVAAWGGDQARYALADRCRIASFVATKDLEQLIRDVRFAIQLSGQEYHWTQSRHDGDGTRLFVDRKMRRYPRPPALYQILLQAILAQAKFRGAGKEFEKSPDEASAGQSAVHTTQSMVVRTEINVKQPGSAPPSGELYVDKLSETACIEGTASEVAGNDESAGA